MHHLAVPTLISESGRAIASHQSVLVFDVLGSSEVPRSESEPPQEADSAIVRTLYEVLEAIAPDNLQECYHDAFKLKEDAVSAFRLAT